MKALGLNFILRKAGNTVSPNLVISNEGNVWSVKIRSTFKNSDFTGAEGEEVTESKCFKLL